jgi:putative ABC transport system permease protein
VQDQLVGPVRRGVQILMVGVVVLVLIGCANVANLMLARTTWRERELAVRAALGASVTRLATLLLAESAIVALVGATLGVMIAVASPAHVCASLRGCCAAPRPRHCGRGPAGRWRAG